MTKEQLIKKIIGPKSKISWWKNYESHYMNILAYSNESYDYHIVGKEKEICDALKEMEDPRTFLKEVENIHTELWREKEKKRREYDEKRKNKALDNGMAVIASIDIGDFIMVKDAQRRERIMRIMDIESDKEVMGRYHDRVVKKEKEGEFTIPYQKYWNNPDYYWDGKTVEKTPTVTAKLAAYIIKKLENIKVI